MPPLTARSVLASALLGMDPPELPVAQLVRLSGLFGISENRARVALSRMVSAGEATTDGSGRYRLTGHLAARQTRQSSSRAGATGLYDGSWWLAVVTTAGSTADVRGTRRRALSYARLAELREGVWMRPANVALRLPDLLEPDVETMTAHPDRPEELAARLWDLAAWSARASDLLERLDRLTRTGRTPWLRDSSSRRRSCVTSSPTRCCPPICSRLSGRAPRCGRPTTRGTRATGTRCRSGAGVAERTLNSGFDARGAAQRQPWGPSSGAPVAAQANPGKPCQ